jgi:hypothetical protein
MNDVHTLPTGILLERETWQKAVEMADGFWIVATRHRPGFMKMQPVVNNRCLVFRLRDQQRDEEVLVVSNGVDPSVIPEIKALEQATGLVVRYVVSPGGGHHLMLPAWRDAFERAEILLPPLRIPSTSNGKKLLAGGRVRLMDLDDPLPQFRGELEAVLFHGLYGFRDTKSPYEGGKDGVGSMFTLMREMMSMRTPVDELWLCHRRSATVIGGENLGWILSEQTVKGFPFLMRGMMKANSVYIQDKARKVADPKLVDKAWRQILEWPCRTLIGYHEPAGEGFIGDGRSALLEAAARAGQLIENEAS